MKIKSIYIGGWFQRTMLQLSEIYDFLRDGTSQLGLEPEKLTALRDNLRIDSIEYGVANEEFVAFTTEEQIRVKLFEDGLMIVSSNQVSEPTIFADVERLRGYYEERLSPVINYLFSSGAPVFKELSSVESIYPYFIVCDNATQNDISELLVKTERQKYFEFDSKNYNVLRGDKYYFINNKKSSFNNIERYIEEQIFIREFKGQLHRYLNLHRAIWSKVDHLRQQLDTSESALAAVGAQLAKYEKTSLLITGRLQQMATYVKIRESSVANDRDLIEFLSISGYRYAALAGTLEYMQSLWQTTQSYITSTQQRIARVEQKHLLATDKTILTLVCLILVVSVLGLLFGTGLQFSVDTLIYAASLIILGMISVKVVDMLRARKQQAGLAERGEDEED